MHDCRSHRSSHRTTQESLGRLRRVQNTVRRIMKQRPELKDHFSHELLGKVLMQYQWDIKHGIFSVEYLAEVLLLSADIHDIALHEELGAQAAKARTAAERVRGR